MSRISTNTVGILAAVFLTAMTFAQTVSVPHAGIPMATIQLA